LNIGLLICNAARQAAKRELDSQAQLNPGVLIDP
jgi:hypothetical protein